jgi:hypothetical protein
MDELEAYSGSREPVPTEVTHNGAAVSHKVRLVPFITGDERPPAANDPSWVTAPLLLEAEAPGYYHIFTMSTDGPLAPISCAGHVRLL